MKKTILLILVITPFLSSAQEKYVVKGKIGMYNNPAKVFLLYSVGGERMADSAILKNGLFEFIGQVKDVTQALLLFDDKGCGLQSFNSNGKYDETTVFLEKGSIIVSTNDSLANAKISGTAVNDDYERYKTILKSVSERVLLLSAEYNSAGADKKSSREFNDYILNKQIAVQQQSKNINNRFIADNPHSYISLQILVDAINTESYPDGVDLKSKFFSLSKNIRESHLGSILNEHLNSMVTVSVGSMAPDFTQPDTSGNPVKLSSFRGKYVLLDFWASWCGPCRSENPNIVEAYKKFKNKNFAILSVSLDQQGKKGDWIKAIHSDGLTWNHVADLKAWRNDAAVLYSVIAIPQNLLIDPYGRILAKNIFGNDLQQKLAAIFYKM